MDFNQPNNRAYKAAKRARRLELKQARFGKPLSNPFPLCNINGEYVRKQQHGGNK